MGAAASLAVRTPGWQLNYKGASISARIERMVTSLTYTSYESGQSPDMEVELEDRNKRWQGPWFPQRGDNVSLSIGYLHESLVPCGQFQVDEVELDGPPDVVKMKCLATPIIPNARTPLSVKYETQSLLSIAQTIASKHGWTVVGAPEAINVTFERVTQNQETDVEFLHRLALQNNYDFVVRGTQLVFYSRTQLELQPPLVTLKRSDVMRFSFTARTKQIYKAATASYFNSETKKLVSATVAANPPVADGDTLNINDRCENGQDATQKAIAALHAANMLLVTGTGTLPGDTALAGGAVIGFSGWGQYDGNFMIQKAIHRLLRQTAYTTEVEVRRVS